MTDRGIAIGNRPLASKEGNQKMKITVDTSAMSFMAASEPEPVLDFESKQPKADENGQPLYAVQVVTITDDGAEVISVKTPSQPQVRAGQMLALGGLVATPWSMGDRSGVAFRAAKVEPVAEKVERGGGRA